MHNPTPLRRHRRALAAGAAISISAVLLAACAPGDDGDGDAAPDEVTTLRVAPSWIANTEYGGFWIADANGYYADEGLEIEWLPYAADVAAEAQLAADAADIGITAGMSTVFAALDDDDFVIVGSVYQQNPGCVLYLADDPIRSAEDLVGKTILAQSETTVQAIFEVNGLTLDSDTTILPTGFDPAPLIEGDGDAYTAYITNQPVTLELSFDMEMGTDFDCILNAELGLPMYASSIFTTPAKLDADRDAYVRFLRASQRGWQEFLADPVSGAELAVNDFGVDLGLDIEQQSRSAQLFATLMESDATATGGLLYMDVDLLATEMYPGMVASGQAPAEMPDLSQVVDLSLLDEIAAG